MGQWANGLQSDGTCICAYSPDWPIRLESDNACAKSSSFVSVLIGAASAHSTAQHQLVPVAALNGEPALELALRKLDTVGNFMMTTAHPDDENNAMLAYFSHGKGYRTSLVTATHGEGGQNEIGPELFVPLAVLRTEELLAAHRFDGAEQFFTRAIDFGFSFSVEETLEKWGHDEILGDYVRMIRTIRPDVIVGFVFDGDGGGQHHQTSSRLTLEAFRAAADPAKFPEQIKEGLRPWQAKKFYYTAPASGPGRVRPAAAGAAACRVPEAPTIAELRGRRAVRSGARPHLRRDRRRSAQHAQVPGHVAAAAVAGVDSGGGGFGGGGPGGVRAYRLRDTRARRRRGAARQGNLRRRRYEPAQLVELLRPHAPAGAWRRARSHHARRSPRRARPWRPVARARRSRRSRPGLKALRDVRASLASMNLSEAARVRDRLPPGAEGTAVRAGADARGRRPPRRGRARRPRRRRPAARDRSAGGESRQAATSTSRSRRTDLARAGRGVHGRRAAGAGRVAQLQPDRDGAGRREADGGAFPQRPPQGARYVFDADVPFGLPFRPTPFTATFAMSRERHAVHDHAADPGALGTRHLQRREARGDSRRARVRGDDDAGDRRGRSTSGAGSGEPGTGQGRARHGDQSREGRGEGRCRARHLPQGWRATPATQAGQLHARRRADDGALRAAAARGGDAGGRGDEAGRQPVRGQDARRPPARRPTRRAIRSIEYPAHHAASRARRSADRGEGARRQREAEPDASAT